eukprot:scaffold1529_cov86-Cylindrotheca_fusiformis.AAC.7
MAYGKSRTKVNFCFDDGFTKQESSSNKRFMKEYTHNKMVVTKERTTRARPSYLPTGRQETVYRPTIEPQCQESYGSEKGIQGKGRFQGSCEFDSPWHSKGSVLVVSCHYPTNFRER